MLPRVNCLYPVTNMKSCYSIDVRNSLGFLDIALRSILSQPHLQYITWPAGVKYTPVDNYTTLHSLHQGSPMIFYGYLLANQQICHL